MAATGVASSGIDWTAWATTALAAVCAPDEAVTTGNWLCFRSLADPCAELSAGCAEVVGLYSVECHRAEFAMAGSACPRSWPALQTDQYSFALNYSLEAE